jgi:hypothetical protein
MLLGFNAHTTAIATPQAPTLKLYSNEAPMMRGSAVCHGLAVLCHMAREDEPRSRTCAHGITHMLRYLRYVLQGVVGS